MIASGLQIFHLTHDSGKSGKGNGLFLVQRKCSKFILVSKEMETWGSGLGSWSKAKSHAMWKMGAGPGAAAGTLGQALTLDVRLAPAGWETVRPARREGCRLGGRWVGHGRTGFSLLGGEVAF